MIPMTDSDLLHHETKLHCMLHHCEYLVTVKMHMAVDFTDGFNNQGIEIYERVMTNKLVDLLHLGGLGAVTKRSET